MDIAGALAAYGLGDARVRLIRHNENLTYCVEERFLLRVHRPAAGFETELLAPGADRAARCESELDYIEALGQAGFAPLQRPVRNLRGQWVTRLSGGAPATLLTWLTGEDAGKAPLTPARCRQWGRRIAELHAVSRRVSRGPAPLRYDAALAERCARRAEELAREGCFPRRTPETRRRRWRALGASWKTRSAGSPSSACTRPIARQPDRHKGGTRAHRFFPLRRWPRGHGLGGPLFRAERPGAVHGAQSGL